MLKLALAACVATSTAAPKFSEETCLKYRSAAIQQESNFKVCLEDRNKIATEGELKIRDLEARVREYEQQDPIVHVETLTPWYATPIAIAILIGAALAGGYALGHASN